MAEGFIQGNMQIKLLIIYVMSRVAEPIRIEDVQALTMIDGGVGYFEFSSCLNHLVETEHLTLSEDGYYEITAKGIHNSAVCESELPYSVRLHADDLVEEFNKELKRRSQVKARYAKRENGTYTVTLALNDDVDNLLQLELMVAAEEMARELVDRFRRNPEAVYSKLVETLFS